MGFGLGVLVTALAPAALAACLSRLVLPSLPWWPFLLAGVAVALAGLWLDRWASRKVWPGPFPRLLWVLFFPAGCLWTLASVLDDWRERRAWPQTVDEAVDELLRRLDQTSRAALRTASDEDLAEFHVDLGMGIRNGFGLWADNR